MLVSLFSLLWNIQFSTSYYKSVKVKPVTAFAKRLNTQRECKLQIQRIDA